MALISVKIKLGDVPTRENYRLMNFLHKNVGDFKNLMKMEAEIVAHAKDGDYPVAYIGQKSPAHGYKKIIAELNSTYNSAMQIDQNDPVESYWRSVRGAGEDGSSGKTAGEEDLSKRLARKTEEREQARPPPKGPGGKQAVAPPSARRTNQDPPSTAPMSRGQQSAPHGPQRPAAPLVGGGGAQPEVGFMQNDPDNPFNMDMDPMARQFWANQSITPGT